jgi:hypothetical protein
LNGDTAQDETRKSRFDQLESEHLICDQVHRQSKEQMRANGRKSDDHEVPLTSGFSDLMASLQTDDPGAIECRPSPISRILAPMRRTEIQDERDFS